MSAIEKIESLLTKIRDNNTSLLNQVRSLPAGEQSAYIERIADIEQRTLQTISEIKRVQP